MAQTQLRGSQIMAGTLTAALLAANFNLPTAQLAEGALFLKRDGTVAWTASQNAGGNTVTGLGTPTNASDAATKSYVDTLLNGFDPKPAAQVMSATNIASKSGTQTIDGVAGTVGMRTLLTGQSTASENGVWLQQSGAWTRPADWGAGSTTAVTDGAYVMVELGTQYGGTGWILTTQGAITVDTTNVAFVQFKGIQTVTGGNGITTTGNSIAVNNGNGLSFDGSQKLTLQLNGGSLSLAAAGLKIADAASAGQVMLGGTANAATFTTLTGDVASVSSAGAVALVSGIRRTTSFVYNETLGGTVNGTNTSFTFATVPLANTAQVYWNGQLLLPGAGQDYTISSGTVTLNFAPSAPDKIFAHYQV